MGRELYELGALFIGVALVALLVRNYQGTTAIISAGTSGFGQLLSTVIGGNQFGGSMSFGPGTMY